MKFRLDYRDWEELVTKHLPLTKEQITHFRKPGVTIYDVFPDKKFHIDFVNHWADFSFNVAARDDFIESFLKATKEDGWYSNPRIPDRYLDDFHVGRALDTYMVTCRKEYRAITNPQDPNKVQERADQVAKNRRKDTVRTPTCTDAISRSIASQLLDSRVLVCSRREWTQFEALWERLRAAHMSEDETDVDAKANKLHPPRWWIIKSTWQSRHLRKYFRKLDQHYRADWASPIRYGKKGKTGGNPPRLRLKNKVNPKEKLGEVPVGLWRNCYRKKFLRTLKPSELRRLRIVDEDFDFTLPEEPPTGGEDSSSESSDEHEVDEMMGDA